MSESPAPALKEIFAAETYRQIAREMTAIYPTFNAARFQALSLAGLDELSLMQRLRRMTESLHATLPASFRKALGLLRKLAPRIERSFVTLALSDYVGQYGQDQFDVSMEALKYFTAFGSSEFAVREFLRRDLPRALAIMTEWSRDENEHVRRLASEGSRPRLPWSFRLEALVTDPSPAAPILEQLRNDPSLDVRKSVANHLNDIAKDHPAWVMDRLESWPLDQPHTAWIAKRALRTLIKQGDRRALAIIGAGAKPNVLLHDLSLTPRKIKLGSCTTLAFRLESRAAKSQRLVVDYIVHYVKKSGAIAAKVFKLKELTLAPGASIAFSRALHIRDFTTRVHHPGRHEVEIAVNGEKLARAFFELTR
ncbi:MAG TPA: DNA alkylation repair protein [Chthoniobacteraceae bacterium]|jgi:3-methyladenine DNA glycosylase AlkC|nr:DNA alkylation repair protein [Chthoniobacteraceae bacterium]